MGAPGLMLRGLRTLYAHRPAAVIDVIAEIGAAGNGLVATASPDDLASAACKLLARCPDPSALPMWGLPVAVGDTLDVAGLETSQGLPALTDLADADAPAVARLRAAGAIIVGKSAVSPLGLDDAASGALAAIGAGRAALALTTDRSGTGLAAAARAGMAALMPTRRVDSAVPELLLAGDLDTLAAAIGRPAGGQSGHRIGLALTGGASATLPATFDGVTVPPVPLIELAALADDPALLAADVVDIETLFDEMPQLFGPVRRRLDRAFAASAAELARALQRRDRLGCALRSLFDSVDLLLADGACAAAPGIAGLPALALADGRLLIGPADSDATLIATARRFADPGRDASPGPIDILSSSPLALC